MHIQIGTEFLDKIGVSKQIPGSLGKTTICVKVRQPWSEDKIEGVDTIYTNVVFDRVYGCRVLFQKFIRFLTANKLNIFTEERIIGQLPSISLASMDW
jgi:hypothetical protein